MKISSRIAGILGVALLLVVSLALILPQMGNEPSGEREKIDLSARGPQVGEQIPDFSLEDQYGQVWTRESILGPNGAMLVFLRSADW